MEISPWHLWLVTSYSRGGVSEVDEEADHREDEDTEHEDLAGAGLARDQLPRPVLGLGVDVAGGQVGALLRVGWGHGSSNQFIVQYSTV